MNVDEMFKRNMQEVRRKEKEGEKFGEHGQQQSRVIIISCMSPWVDPADIFSLKPGEAYVIRNAGNLVTQDTMRCILLAMIKDKITDIIVLGHLNCTNADIKSVTAKYRTLVEKIPQASKYRELLGTKDKALKYFMMFQDEIDNVTSQVENVRFFKTIQPTINITGMLYNAENGLVYSFSEIKELQKLMSKEFPSKEKINKIIPKRYKDFLKDQKGQEKPSPVTQRSKESTIPKKAPAKSPQKIVSTERGTTTIESKAKTTVKPLSRKKLAPLTPKPAITEEKPSAVEPMETNEELQSKMDFTQKNFEIMEETMQKSMARITSVHIFVPKVHIPVVRIPGRKAEKKEEE